MYNITTEELLQIEISLLKDNINNLKRKQDYINGVKPPYGFIWEIKDDNYSFVIDKSTLNENHPDFLEYVKSQAGHRIPKFELFEAWLNNTLNPSISNTFRQVYAGAVYDLIPEGTTVLDKIPFSK